VSRLFAVVVIGLAGCGDTPAPRDQAAADPAVNRPRDEPPMVLNADIPIRYPERLASAGLGGTVVLRLFVDSAGRIVPESTAVQESSGHPGLDSAALAGADRLRFAPALVDGNPVAARFLQPIDFAAAPTPPSTGGGSRP